MGNENSQKDKRRDSRVSLLNELYIDILGSLVPGLLVVVLASVVLGWSGKTFCSSLSAFTKSTSNSVVSEWHNLEFGSYGTAAIALAIGYVLGSIFYRQDPKLPDYRSASRAWRSTKSKEDRDKLAVQPLSGHEANISPSDAQFPYYFIYEYLDGRGSLKRLAEWVPWKGKDSTTWGYRTKMFINQIKIRLQFLVPEKCKNIVRNEAHVRLATSLWYATRWLIGVSCIGLLLILAAVFMSLPKPQPHQFAGVFGFDLLVFVLALLTKFKIENFIHYLRVREIVYVLETADFAQRNDFDLHPEDFKIKGQSQATKD